MKRLLKAARRKLNLSQQEMAQRAGVSISQISRLEIGMVNPQNMHPRMRRAIAAAYGFDPVTGETVSGVGEAGVKKGAAAEPSAA